MLTKSKCFGFKVSNSSNVTQVKELLGSIDLLTVYFFNILCSGQKKKLNFPLKMMFLRLYPERPLIPSKEPLKSITLLVQYFLDKVNQKILVPSMVTFNTRILSLLSLNFFLTE